MFRLYQKKERKPQEQMVAVTDLQGTEVIFSAHELRKSLPYLPSELAEIIREHVLTPTNAPSGMLTDPETLQMIVKARETYRESQAAYEAGDKRTRSGAYPDGVSTDYIAREREIQAEQMRQAELDGMPKATPKAIKFSTYIDRSRVALVAYPDASGIEPGDMLAAVQGDAPSNIEDPNDLDKPEEKRRSLGSVDTIRGAYVVETVTGRVIIARFMPRPDRLFESLFGSGSTLSSGDRFVPVTAESAATGHILYE